MQRKQIKIINKLGLHTRSTSKLISLTSRYSSDIKIIYNNRVINGKSIMETLTLGAAQGSILDIITNGDDELELIEAVEELINNKFGEEK